MTEIERLARLIGEAVTGYPPDTQISKYGELPKTPIGWIIDPDSVMPLWRGFCEAARVVDADRRGVVPLPLPWNSKDCIRSVQVERIDNNFMITVIPVDGSGTVVTMSLYEGGLTRAALAKALRDLAEAVSS